MSSEPGRTNIQIVAVAVGAATYIAAAFIRTGAISYLGPPFSGHLIGSIDALLIYITALLPGFVAATLFRSRIFVTGFVAGAVGELARSVIKLLPALHAAGWMAINTLPMDYISDIFFSAVATGILGAAGAAVAVVSRRI